MKLASTSIVQVVSSCITGSISFSRRTTIFARASRSRRLKHGQENVEDGPQLFADETDPRPAVSMTSGHLQPGGLAVPQYRAVEGASASAS